jgi:hypothetical protein
MRQHPSPGSRPRIRIDRRTVPAPESIINLSIAIVIRVLFVSRVRAWIAPSSRVDANQRLESMDRRETSRGVSARGIHTKYS